MRPTESAAATGPRLVPGHTRRLRATFNRTGGIRHLFAALDLGTGQLFYRFRDRKRWQEFLGFLKQMRARFPAGKLYLVGDNYPPHATIEVAGWCHGNGVELVFTRAARRG